jgi:hypothetical protein
VLETGKTGAAALVGDHRGVGSARAVPQLRDNDEEQ